MNKGKPTEWEKTYRKLKEGECLWSRFPEIEDFIPLAKRDDVKRVLDAGCGDGKNLTALLHETQFFCVGCDSSRSALEVCEKEIKKGTLAAHGQGKVPKQRFEEVCLVETPLQDMPFLDGFFDAAICIDVINHNKDPYAIIGELCRVVKRNGLIYFSLFNVQDEILTNPEYAKPMKPICDGIPGREFMYHFINGEGEPIEYYFRFLHFEEVEEFLKPTRLQIINKRVKRWWNPPHPHFRPYEHTHCNIMVTARNR